MFMQKKAQAMMQKVDEDPMQLRLENLTLPCTGFSASRWSRDSEISSSRVKKKWG